MIYQTVNLYKFRQAFVEAGRADQFSYDGLSFIYDYLQEAGDVELNVIAICCDFCESDWESIASEYGLDLSDCDDDDESISKVRGYLESNATVVGDSGGSFVYANF